METIKTQCVCGEAISVDIDVADTCRKDGKRPHYPDDVYGYVATQFRCRACGGWLGDTCKEAVFNKDKDD